MNSICSKPLFRMSPSGLLYLSFKEIPGKAVCLVLQDCTSEHEAEVLTRVSWKGRDGLISFGFLSDAFVFLLTASAFQVLAVRHAPVGAARVPKRRWKKMRVKTIESVALPGAHAAVELISSSAEASQGVPHFFTTFCSARLRTTLSIAAKVPREVLKDGERPALSVFRSEAPVSLDRTPPAQEALSARIGKTVSAAPRPASRPTTPHAVFQETALRSCSEDVKLSLAPRTQYINTVLAMKRKAALSYLAGKPVLALLGYYEPLFAERKSMFGRRRRYRLGLSGRSFEESSETQTASLGLSPRIYLLDPTAGGKPSMRVLADLRLPFAEPDSTSFCFFDGFVIAFDAQYSDVAVFACQDVFRHVCQPPSFATEHAAGGACWPSIRPLQLPGLHIAPLSLPSLGLIRGLAKPPLPAVSNHGAIAPEFFFEDGIQGVHVDPSLVVPVGGRAAFFPVSLSNAEEPSDFLFGAFRLTIAAVAKALPRAAPHKSLSDLTSIALEAHAADKEAFLAQFRRILDKAIRNGYFGTHLSDLLDKMNRQYAAYLRATLVEDALGECLTAHRKRPDISLNDLEQVAQHSIQRSLWSSATGVMFVPKVVKPFGLAPYRVLEGEEGSRVYTFIVSPGPRAAGARPAVSARGLHEIDTKRLRRLLDVCAACVYENIGKCDLDPLFPALYQNKITIDEFSFLESVLAQIPSKKHQTAVLLEYISSLLGEGIYITDELGSFLADIVLRSKSAPALFSTAQLIASGAFPYTYAMGLKFLGSPQNLNFIFRSVGMARLENAALGPSNSLADYTFFLRLLLSQDPMTALAYARGKYGDVKRREMISIARRTNDWRVFVRFFRSLYVRSASKKKKEKKSSRVFRREDSTVVFSSDVLPSEWTKSDSEHFSVPSVIKRLKKSPSNDQLYNAWRAPWASQKRNPATSAPNSVESEEVLPARKHAQCISVNRRFLL
eukprot:gnl/Chilomastix_cuspidata/483.p1 GENE.gnl/Chilomastix_cuspidata/483~~gnl/Chilomastix_cuspidata/483.p1  ORF type:complete len:1032 (-),score=230.59 gnl/Chilomastix_cuspidata/483:4839-7697(-)